MKPNDGLKNLISDFDKLLDSIFRFIYLRVNNKEVAEDLTQDCFLSAVNYLRENSVKSLKPFLYSTARHKVIDYYRGRRRAVAFKEIIETIIEPVQDDFWKNFEDLNDARLLLKKLNLLEVDDRDILMMRYLDELEIKEIAKIIGKNAIATRVRISRALKRARKLYE